MSWSILDEIEKIVGSKRGIREDSIEAKTEAEPNVQRRSTDTKIDPSKLFAFSNVCPFRWHQNQYRCFCCDLTFLDIQPLRTHTQTEHNFEQIKQKTQRQTSAQIKVDITSLTCTVCSTPIDEFNSLVTHLTSTHDKLCNDLTSEGLVPFKLDRGAFQCQVCRETFQGFHILNQHMNCHYRNYICEVCGAGFSKRESYRYHTITHRTGKFICTICKIPFPTVYSKDAHMKREHKKEYVRKCPHCPERFKEHYARLKHLVAVHGAPRSDHRCASCNKAFPMKYSLNTHIRNVHLKGASGELHRRKAEFAHKCPQCPERFKQSSHRRVHMGTVHGVSPEEFKCEFCHKTFVRKSALNTHMRGVHLNDRQHMCENCSFKAIDKTELSRHMVTWHGAESFRYRCEVCGKGYSRKYTLTNHMKSHDTENRCSLCGIKFVNVVSLKQHCKVQHPDLDAS